MVVPGHAPNFELRQLQVLLLNCQSQAHNPLGTVSSGRPIVDGLARIGLKERRDQDLVARGFSLGSQTGSQFRWRVSVREIKDVFRVASKFMQNHRGKIFILHTRKRVDADQVHEWT